MKSEWRTRLLLADHPKAAGRIEALARRGYPAKLTKKEYGDQLRSHERGGRSPEELLARYAELRQPWVEGAKMLLDAFPDGTWTMIVGEWRDNTGRGRNDGFYYGLNGGPVFIQIDRNEWKSPGIWRYQARAGLEPDWPNWAASCNQNAASKACHKTTVAAARTAINRINARIKRVAAQVPKMRDKA